MWVLGGLGTGACWLWRGPGWGAGFAVGAFLSALNFHWMKTAVTALADLAASPPIEPADAGAPRRQVRSGGIVIRFMLRYALIGVAGYAIFKSSFISLGAFFLGLFLFVAAISAEMGYQIYRGFRSS
jgi:hypothetical protein